MDQGFSLRAGQTEYFSIALVYGDDKDDLVRNKKTVQNIYDNDYRFPSSPQKPTLTAVPGDNEVTLYWDFIAEQSVDPLPKKWISKVINYTGLANQNSMMFFLLQMARK